MNAVIRKSQHQKITIYALSAECQKGCVMSDTESLTPSERERAEELYEALKELLRQGSFPAKSEERAERAIKNWEERNG